MIIQPLLEANTLKELQVAVGTLASHYWKARDCHYLAYDENKHVLLHEGQEWDLSAQHQPGASALNLRAVADQSLPWPEALKGKGSYRMCQPIFHWGSLKAILCLGFEQQPQDLEDFEEVIKSLGILGDRVGHQEGLESFVGRCKELLVQAVEAQGKSGHVQRCCRLVSSLATMLDCSSQTQAELLEAAQYHDIGLLTFANQKSPEAIREHPRVAASLLRCHPDMHEIAQLVENHQEKYDGSGPYGKRAEELSLECWLLATAEDFVEFWEGSMATYEMKIKEFFVGPAKHHHPDVIDALCGLVDSGRLQELME